MPMLRSHLQLLVSSSTFECQMRSEGLSLPSQQSALPTISDTRTEVCVSFAPKWKLFSEPAAHILGSEKSKMMQQAVKQPDQQDGLDDFFADLLPSKPVNASSSAKRQQAGSNIFDGDDNVLPSKMDSPRSMQSASSADPQAAAAGQNCTASALLIMRFTLRF